MYVHVVISNTSGLHFYNYLHTVFTTNDTQDLLLFSIVIIG